MIKQSSELTDLPEVARWVLAEAKYPVILFKGLMGSGKTTLIKAVARQLKVEDEVSSPSFSLVNEYASPEGAVYHFDFYRLKHEEEALDIGLDEYLYSGQPCLIEWPEKIRNFLPSDCTLVRIDHQGSQRTYEIIQPIDE